MKIKLCQISRETDCPCLCVPEHDTDDEVECNLGYTLEQGSLKDHDDSTTYFSRNCRLNFVSIQTETEYTAGTFLRPTEIDDNELAERTSVSREMKTLKTELSGLGMTPAEAIAMLLTQT